MTSGKCTLGCFGYANLCTIFENIGASEKQPHLSTALSSHKYYIFKYSLFIGVVGGRALSLMHDNAVPSNIASKLRDHFVKEYNLTAFDADFEVIALGEEKSKRNLVPTGCNRVCTRQWH